MVKKYKLNNILSTVSSLTYDKGIDYYNEQRVINLECTNVLDFKEYYAIVNGTKSYRTKLIIDGELYVQSYSCSCPVEGFCKHLVATSLAIINIQDTITNVPTNTSLSYNLLTYKGNHVLFKDLYEYLLANVTIVGSDLDSFFDSISKKYKFDLLPSSTGNYYSELINVYDISSIVYIYYRSLLLFSNSTSSKLSIAFVKSFLNINVDIYSTLTYVLYHKGKLSSEQINILINKNSNFQLNGLIYIIENKSLANYHFESDYEILRKSLVENTNINDTLTLKGFNLDNLFESIELYIPKYNITNLLVIVEALAPQINQKRLSLSKFLELYEVYNPSSLAIEIDKKIAICNSYYSEYDYITVLNSIIHYPNTIKMLRSKSLLKYYYLSQDTSFIDNRYYLPIINSIPFKLKVNDSHEHDTGGTYFFTIVFVDSLEKNILFVSRFTDSKYSSYEAMFDINIDESGNHYLVLRNNILNYYVGEIGYDGSYYYIPKTNEVSKEFNKYSFSNQMLNDYNSYDDMIFQARDDYRIKRLKKSADKRLEQLGYLFASNSSLKLNELVDILPVIYTSNNEDTYTLAAKIGFSDKMYVVKNFHDLLDSIENEEKVTYGKKLSFIATLDNFTPSAKELISCLMFAKWYDTKSFEINGITLAKILEIRKNNIVSIDDIDLIVRGEFNPKIEMRGNVIVSNNGKNELLMASNEDYMINNNSIEKVEYPNESFMHLYRSLCYNGNIDISYSKDSFYTNVYPYIKSSVEIDKSLLNDIPLANFTINSYIDYEHGIITLLSKYYLYDKEITLLEAKEYSAILSRYDIIIGLLGFVDNIIKDKDDIYQFIKTDLSGLKDVANVFLSEAITKLYKMKKLEFNFNASSTEDSMLDVFFTDLNFSDKELEKIYNAYRKKKKYILLDDALLELENNKELDELAGYIEDFNFDPKHISNEVINPIHTLFKLEGKYDNVKLNDKAKMLIDNIINYQDNTNLPNEMLYSNLRPYQKNGYLWMRTLFDNGLNGILADDMGIGKTIQTIALIDSMKEDLPILVICPKNIIYNWEAEIKKWAPHLEAKVIEGLSTQREAYYSKLEKKKTIIITSFDCVRRDKEYLTRDFGLIIIDEAQNIKNPNTARSIEIRSLKARHKLCLTGTPIENQMLDLWSMFDFLMSGYLFSYDNFMKMVERPQNINLLKRKVLPFILRRTKKEVLKDLPPKIEEIIYVNMDTDQRKIYESFLLQAKKEMEEDPTNKIKSLASLTRLRQICVDPSILLDDYNGSKAKTEFLTDSIDELINNEHKIIIFSQFVKYLEVLEQVLINKKISYYLISGKTGAKDRQTMANDFNTNDSVKIFLVSLKAGGVGLNLIGADTVIHVDPWWNQAAEDQASDRAYRIGQTKSINVYKLVCKSTLEEKIVLMQKRKKELAEAIINEDDENFTALNKEDLSFLIE